VYKGYGGMIAEERYSPAGFRLALGLKDVRLAVEAGQARRFTQANAATNKATLQYADAQGDAALEQAALGKHAARRGGLN
jgi:3-hydroxyisobutyrate dehydrogenase-like beta-hydroxyacid dehydrogenase